MIAPLLNRMTVMKFPLPILLIGTCLLVLMGYGQRPVKGVPNPKAASYRLPVKEQLASDSTEITATTVASGLDVPWEIVRGPSLRSGCLPFLSSAPPAECLATLSTGI